MTRGASSKTTGQTRRCIATGEDLPKDQMIRFALSPDGVVTPDVASRLPGRGIWVSATRSALELAISKNLFSRGAKAKATLPDDLYALTDRLLARRVSDLISMARRSGQAIQGFETVKGALISEKARVLIQAHDGSGAQKQKLRPPTNEHSYIGCLTSAELGLAFGRDYVIHAALTGHGLRKSITAEAERLGGLRDAKNKAKAK